MTRLILTLCSAQALAAAPANGPCPPSNSPAVPVAGGAASTADVIMELRYAGIFSGGDNSGLYQRLAVGSEAVKQPGASVMFARDNSGQLDTKTAEVLAALKSAETPAPLLDAKYKFTACYNSPEGKKRIDGILTNQSFAKYLRDNPTTGQMDDLYKQARCTP